jgi:hypothetical protein
VHDRFHRGECITLASGGEGALDTPGPLNGIEEAIDNIILCNCGQHVPYRWLLISNKLCDSTLCTCGGVGGGEEQVHNVDYDPVKIVGGVNRESRERAREREEMFTQEESKWHRH